MQPAAPSSGPCDQRQASPTGRSESVEGPRGVQICAPVTWPQGHDASCGSGGCRPSRSIWPSCLPPRSLPQAHYTPLAALRLACLTAGGAPAHGPGGPADLQDYPVITVEVSPAPWHLVQPAQVDAVFRFGPSASTRPRQPAAWSGTGLGVAVADGMTVRRAAIDQPGPAAAGASVQARSASSPTYRRGIRSRG